jgi:hypothetical protein
LETSGQLRYAFLGAGRYDLLGDFVWPEAVWLEREFRPVQAQELVERLDDELWRIDVTGARARLVERVQEWNEDAAGAFVESCIRRACELGLGHAEGTLAELEHAVQEKLRDEPGDVLAYAADTFALARGARPEQWNEPGANGVGSPGAGAIAANLGFVVAHVAGRAAAAAGRDYAAGFDEERERQRAWLVERLGL